MLCYGRENMDHRVLWEKSVSTNGVDTDRQATDLNDADRIRRAALTQQMKG
jgi:hypothetical protein